MTPMSEPDKEVPQFARDIQTILNEAEAHGTLHRLKDVAIYFDEAELRAILAAVHVALRSLPGREGELEEALRKIIECRAFISYDAIDYEPEWPQDIARRALSKAPTGTG